MKSMISPALLLSLAGASISSFSVSAQSSMAITISGEVQADSCTPTVSGINGNTLQLQPKTMSQMNASDPSIPGSNITFSVSGCTQNNMWTHFTAADISNGRINTGHPQVQFQIRDLNNGVLGGQVDVGGSAGTSGPSASQGTGVAITGGAASKSYAVHYYRSVPTVTQPGGMSASATYTVKYY